MSAPRDAAPRGWPVDGALLALVALAVAAALAPRVAGFTTDSDAYLDVAANLRAGRGLVQSAVDFWRPALPDPLGMWPPLYPALVALVAACGVPLELAARLVAAAGLAAFAAAFHALAGRAVGRGPAALVTLLVLASPGVARLGAFAWSEAPFLALATAGLAVLAGSAADAGGRLAPSLRAALVAGALLGLAAVTRSAGLALVVVTGAMVLLGGAPARARLAFVAAAAALPAAWMARNLVLFGRPTGPALPAGASSPATQLFEMARALRWELVPGPLAATAPVAYALVALLAVGLGLALWRGGTARLAAACGLALLAVTLVATSALAINAPTGRYLAPALPFLWLGAIAGLRGTGRGGDGTRRTLVHAGVAMLALAAATHLAGWAGAQRVPAVEATLRRDDRGALAALLAGGSGPVLSDHAHLARLASGRPAVQVPPPAFRARDYTAADDARWAKAGVNVAVFEGSAPPPAGTWVAETTAGRFTRWARR